MSRKATNKSHNGQILCQLLVFSFMLIVLVSILFYIRSLMPNPHNYINKQSAIVSSLERYINSPMITLPTIVDSKKIESNPSNRKRIAFIITITKDGFFQDGAAVLVYSIIKYTQYSNFDKSFIAFVHPNVTTSRSGLRKLGFHVIEAPIPINVSAIKFDFLREKINKNGCCGSAELIKLTSYRLMQYDWIVHMDADTILLNPIDELFALNYSLIYTTDPNMASYKGEEKMPVQGGFIVLKPSLSDYTNIIDIIMTTEFRKGGGWNRTRIGWCWGGMTIQGVLPYYYNIITQPYRSTKLDRCYYNTMADTEPCSTQKIEELKSAHFTVCQKPWGCLKDGWGVGKRLCEDLHRKWFELRNEAEAFYGVPVVKGCTKLGHPKHYIKMNLDDAIMPKNHTLAIRIVPDDSLDRIEPMKPVSRYITSSYD
eukprot:gene10758-14448_t